MVALRHELVAALSDWSSISRRAKTHRFLCGLSADELQFIAEFLGSCILARDVCPEAAWTEAGRCSGSRARLAESIATFPQFRTRRSGEGTPDRDHKMILLLEYLWRSGLHQVAASSGSRVH